MFVSKVCEYTRSKYDVQSQEFIVEFAVCYYGDAGYQESCE